MEQRKVIRSAILIGGFTSMSRVLGLVRDFLTAGFFGTSPAMSAFVVAFRIPNLFRALFGEGALSSAFVPVFIEARQKEGDQRAWLLARKVITLVATVLFAVVLAGIAAITLVLRRPDLGVKTGMILPLVRIMLPYMMFICLAALSTREVPPSSAARCRIATRRKASTWSTPSWRPSAREPGTSPSSGFHSRESSCTSAITPSATRADAISARWK